MRIALIVLLMATRSLAQEPTEQQTPPSQQGRPPMQAPSPEPKPYEKVITKEARSKPGVFTVDQVKDKWYYEIPASEMGPQFLWVTKIARTALGAGYSGTTLTTRVVRWERNQNKVFLRNVNYEVVADNHSPIARAVSAINNDTILMSFNVEAFGKDGSAVIDVGRLFTTDIFEFGAKTMLRATGLDTSRSFIERISSYPANIEVENTLTYTVTPPPTTAAPQPQPLPSPFLPRLAPGSGTLVLHHSMVKLPETPMMARLFDERVGFFSVRQMDYGRDEQRAPKRTYITRWRLEKKDPSADVSEPGKPIVYYVDPATPAKWAPWVKRGVEDWQPAFEAAGFKNAILAKDAPTADPDWSPEDMRYSVIHWQPSTIENAVGPNIHDPRTGEILNAPIEMYHNVMNLVRDWYFVQVAPLDPRAQKVPLPDELMGRLIEFVAAHEVGHTLGLQHNMKASSTYPQEKVRDRDWVHKMSHTPSIMDYSRFNYVAQPEDNIDVADLVPGIGPYDRFAIGWGYKPIGEAHNPDDEKPTLDEWSRQQDTTPWLRFSVPGAFGADPGDNTEAVGDADAITSTALGLRNLERVSKLLLPGTTAQRGEPYDDLKELYERMLGQWRLEMGHVAAIVGGLESQEKYVGQAGVIFTPVARERQAEAVKFLNERAFTTPAMFLRPEILRRIEPVGALERIRLAQRGVLDSLLSDRRLARVVEQEALDGAKAYPATEFLAGVRHGIWKELEGSGAVKIDAYRRNLQRSYVDLMNDRLNRPVMVVQLPAIPGIVLPPGTEETRPLFRGELKTLSASVAAAIPRAADRITRIHLEDIKDQIARVLDPKFAPPASAVARSIFGFGTDTEAWPENADSCWPDYRIKLPGEE